MCGFPEPGPSGRGRSLRGFSRGALRFLLPFLLFSVFASASHGEDFTIRSFRSAIEVRADSSLRVIETIETEFARARHGIYRDIPFRYVDELGKTSVTPLTVLSVADSSGTGWNYKVMRIGSNLRIRIGDPERYVNGRQTYVISYLVENGLLFFPDHDELYWNVTGNGWPVPIDSATAVVTFAEDLAPSTPRTRCLTGPRGSREEACTIASGGDGFVFQASRPFRAYEGMTIVLGWDKGIVHPSTGLRTKLYEWNLPEYWPIALPSLAFLFMLVLWYRKGRDPRTGDPLVVAYAPPEEGGRPLLPAEAGTLLDERFDSQDLTASVVDLAVKGYLSIAEEKTEGFLFDKTDHRLRRLKKAEADLPAFERLLLDKLFEGHGSEVRISELRLSFYKHLEDLRKAVFGGLERFRYFAARPMSVKSAYMRTGALIAVPGLLSGVVLQKIWGWETGLYSFCAALSGAIVVFFARFMPVKTLRGVRALERIKGFEEFLMRAEKDRLERMDDPRLFEKYLPYAIALGVSERWAEAFEGIVQEPPRWYSSGGGIHAFRTSVFHHSLSTALSGMASAMTAAPRSGGSGFSGGGGSGGGGGGGGGGSW